MYIVILSLASLNPFEGISATLPVATDFNSKYSPSSSSSKDLKLNSGKSCF